MHKLVKESIDFQRGSDSKQSMGIGKNRYKKTGDREFGSHFLIRDTEEGNGVHIINTINGKIYTVGLFSAAEVINALKYLID